MASSSRDPPDLLPPGQPDREPPLDFFGREQYDEASGVDDSAVRIRRLVAETLQSSRPSSASAGSGLLATEGVDEVDARDPAALPSHAVPRRDGVPDPSFRAVRDPTALPLPGEPGPVLCEEPGPVLCEDPPGPDSAALPLHESRDLCEGSLAGALPGVSTTLTEAVALPPTSAGVLPSGGDGRDPCEVTPSTTSLGVNSAVSEDVVIPVPAAGVLPSDGGDLPPDLPPALANVGQGAVELHSVFSEVAEVSEDAHSLLEVAKAPEE